jgi:hypothetical protein
MPALDFTVDTRLLSSAFPLLEPLLATVLFVVADFADPLVTSAGGDAASLAATTTAFSSFFPLQHQISIFPLQW